MTAGLTTSGVRSRCHPRPAAARPPYRAKSRLDASNGSPGTNALTARRTAPLREMAGDENSVSGKHSNATVRPSRPPDAFPEREDTCPGRSHRRDRPERRSAVPMRFSTPAGPTERFLQTSSLATGGHGLSDRTGARGERRAVRRLPFPGGYSMGSDLFLSDSPQFGQVVESVDSTVVPHSRHSYSDSVDGSYSGSSGGTPEPNDPVIIVLMHIWYIYALIRV